MDEPQRLAVVVSAFMRVVQTTQDVAGDAKGVLHGNGTSHRVGVVDDPAHRATRDVLHGNEVGASVLAEVVNLHDVRVVKQSLDPRLVDEHGFNLAVTQQLLVDAFDDEGFFEATGPGFLADEDLSHAARGQQLCHFVGTNALQHPEIIDSRRRTVKPSFLERGWAATPEHRPGAGVPALSSLQCRDGRET